MTPARIALLAALCVVGTIVIGWWSLVIVGGLRGLPPFPRRAAWLESAVAGGLGWGALLLWSAIRGPVWRLAGEVGPIFHVPGWAFVLMTLAFAILAAAAAAALTGQISRERGR